MNTTQDNKVHMKTLVDLLESLRKQGYTENFMATHKGTITIDTKKDYTPEEVKINSFYRFEGESDPADNAICYAIQTNDGKKGVLTDAYGPYSDTKVTKFVADVENIQKKDRNKPSLLRQLRNLFAGIVGVYMLVFGLSACVSKKKFKALDAKYNTLSADYTNLNNRYNDLNKSKAEGEQMSQEELQKLNNELKQKLSDLQAANTRVVQLQDAIAKQKKSQQDLLAKITNALIGIPASDLTAEIRADGKVYVSLSEKLLFKSGKYDVDPKGKEALAKLAMVLSTQPDIDIEVEGHTDNVPFKKAVLADNLDLSVMRATSIVRILTVDYGVNPKQVSASGRGESFPIASNDTPEGRASNRRTEIILSPKISDLYKILSGN